MVMVQYDVGKCIPLETVYAYAYVWAQESAASLGSPFIIRSSSNIYHVRVQR